MSIIPLGESTLTATDFFHLPGLILRQGASRLLYFGTCPSRPLFRELYPDQELI